MTKTSEKRETPCQYSISLTQQRNDRNRWLGASTARDSTTEACPWEPNVPQYLSPSSNSEDRCLTKFPADLSMPKLPIPPPPQSLASCFTNPWGVRGSHKCLPSLWSVVTYHLRASG